MPNMMPNDGLVLLLSDLRIQIARDDEEIMALRARIAELENPTEEQPEEMNDGE